jgi:hypothetical protein
MDLVYQMVSPLAPVFTVLLLAGLPFSQVILESFYRLSLSELVWQLDLLVYYSVGIAIPFYFSPCMLFHRFSWPIVALVLPTTSASWNKFSNFNLSFSLIILNVWAMSCRYLLLSSESIPASLHLSS